MTVSASRRHQLLATASVIMIPMALAVVVAVPAQAVTSPQVSNSPHHVWIDPTKPTQPNDYLYTVTLGMPTLSNSATTDYTAPSLTDGSRACQYPAPESGGQLICHNFGTAIPGEYEATVTITDGATQYDWVIPITVCPLTGCEELFSLTISPQPMYVWSDPHVTDQTPGVMRFNVPWNPVEVRMTPLVDRVGNPPAGDWQPVFEPPADGSAFAFQGTFTQRGVYYTTITVEDEFGYPHSADATVVVCDSRGCPVLPDTGANSEGHRYALMIALVAIIGGVFLASRRWNLSRR